MDRKYYLKGIARAKINGHESQPNDAGGVHGKTNEFGLVEIFRDLKKITMVFHSKKNRNGNLFQTNKKIIMEIFFKNCSDL